MSAAETALAFWFPGQGSQSVGMLQSFAGEKTARQTWAEAADALDFDLLALVRDGPEQKLRLTEYAQPALLAAGVLLWRLWGERGGTSPGWLAGHSLGEFTALVCAGSLDFAPALRLVRQRGRFMQSAVELGRGGMSAVLGLEDQQVENCCAEVDEKFSVEAVNYNAPGQVVIAGEREGVEQAARLCRQAGAKHIAPLPVSAPFHTRLMRPAGEKLARELAQLELRPPAVPVLHNVHAETEADTAEIQALLVRQIYSPVRWSQCVRRMVALGVKTAVECGPGKVLCGLGRRIERPMRCLPLDPETAFSQALSAV